MKILILTTLTLLLLQCGVPLPPTPPPTPYRSHSSETLSSDPPCDKELWKHTYGAMKRFGDVIDPARPEDRNVLKHRCVTVRGVIKEGPSEEKDGDVKIKIEVEPLTFAVGYYKYDDILKPENKGLLPVEFVCATKVTNPGCNDCRKVCLGYTPRYSKQTIFQQFTKGKWVDVTGELITDTGVAGDPPKLAHGGTEIHPVTEVKLSNSR